MIRSSQWFALMLLLVPYLIPLPANAFQGSTNPYTLSAACGQPGLISQYDPNLTGQLFPGYDPQIAGCPNPDARLSAALLTPPDQLRLFSLGVNPGTLQPEGLDLNIFPSYPVSESLSLIPSLSYSADATLSRQGTLAYGPPKQWRNHYGEIVRLIAPQANAHAKSLGSLKPPGNSELNERHGVPVEIQTYFINATGQEVNFYPDPTGVADGTPVTQWYSESGNYRLRKQSYQSSPPEFYDLELDTPGGLVFRFEKYARRLSRNRESLAV